MSRLQRLKDPLRDLAERQARDLPAARRLRFALAREALERFADGASLSVLDAGCGEGRLTLEVARRHPNWSVLGVDVAEDRLRLGRQRARTDRLDNARFAACDLTRRLPWDGFDAVLAIECLEEIPDDDAALRAMAGALRPGGLFLASVPLDGWRPVLPGSETTWRDEVRHGYGADELERRLAEAGLSLRVAAPSSHALVRLAQELRDRLRHRSLKLVLLTLPLALAVTWLERRGIAPGSPRALFVEAVRP